MSKVRRNLNPLPPLTPAGSDTPAPSRKPDTMPDAMWWKRLLHLERKRNGQVMTILTRHVTSLERQVEDLRSAYFTNLAPKPTEKK